MAIFSYVGPSTTTVLLTKNLLANLTTAQAYAADYLVEDVTNIKLNGALNNIAQILNTIFKLPSAADIVAEMGNLALEYNEDITLGLERDIYVGWNSMIKLRDAWNGRNDSIWKTYDIAQIRVTFPTKVFKNTSNGKHLSLITGEGRLVGIVTTSGLELTV